MTASSVLPGLAAALIATAPTHAEEDTILSDWAREMQLFEALDRLGTMRPATTAQRPVQGQPQAGTVTDWPAFWSQGKAQGRGPVRFTHLPMQVEDIERFVPYGLMVGGHVCPIDHCYFFPKALQPGQPHFGVQAPADGFIVVIGHRTQLTGSTERAREYDDYSLIIEHSGTFYTQYDLLTSLDDAVLAALDADLRARLTGRAMMPQTHVRIPVKAGQVIGKVGGRSLDFGVVNTESRLAGFLTPALYGHYSWRVHLADPFEFLDEPLKGRLMKLNVRKAAPPGGKIDHDVDGALPGNWFREGSGGYAGDRNDPRGYWMGHLAFAYHHVDPSRIVISIGDFGGRPAQFWVRGNTPDPAKVTEKEGVVKYELVHAALSSTGQAYEGTPGDVQGVVLAQVLPGRRMKFEVFPGRSSEEVEGFTGHALTFER